MITQILTWWLVLQVFGLLGLPLAAFLFSSLPDRGYAFSKSLGLLLTGYGAWLLAMLGLGSFGGPLVLLVMAVLGITGLLLLHSQWGISLHTAALHEHLQASLRLHWRGILTYEVLFLLALVFMAWVRSYQPHPWGTERPMDFAFFNAIRYGSAFPPADPWLAGFSINYYYFGYMLMALVALLSGLEPAVAFNLSLAGIFALTALGVAGIISNLIGLESVRAFKHASLQTENQEPESQEPETANQESGAEEPGAGSQAPGTAAAPGFVGRALAALLGVVLVLLVGNQAGALQVIVGDPRVVVLDGPQLVSAVTQAISGSDASITLPYPAHTSEGDFGTFATLENADRFNNFNWWWPSRALWDVYETVDDPAAEVERRRYNITEFPFFSFWLGDMHPHVMALPFDLLAVALALATLARPTLPRFAVGRAGWLELLCTGVILGSLYTINSWDLPTYILLYGGALVLLYARLTEHFTAGVWRSLGQQFGLALLALVLLFLPFFLTFRSLVGFAEPLVNLPILGRLTQIVAPVVTGRSELHAFFIIFGLFFIPLAAFVYLCCRSRRSHAPHEQTEHASQDNQAGTPDQEHRPAWHIIFNPWVTPALLVVGLLIDFPLLALAGLGLLAFYRALRPELPPAEKFVLLVVALGCAICFGTEVIFIRDVFNNRMNTIFKFYYQVWLLWGTVSAFALWWLLSQSRQPIGRRVAAYGTAALFLLLLAGGLVYPALNLRDVARHGTQIGLEGWTPRGSFPAGKTALHWLRENAPPDSVVLEMVDPQGGSYNGAGYAGVAAATGHPTVLGWYGHQIQWRGGDPVAMAELEPRKNDVDQIYRTTNPVLARELLEKYSVDYVYVGKLERRAYSAASLAKFSQIATPVFQQGEVTIYRLLEQ